MHYTTVPAELVKSYLESQTVSREDIDAIRDPREPHRLRGTYEHKHGGRYRVFAYRARVFKFFELSSGFATRELAARAVVAFYKANFGEKWKRAFKHSKTIPWRVRRVERAGLTVYRADIFVRGCPVAITRADTGESTSGNGFWATPEDAKRAARLAMARRFEKEREKLPIPAPQLLFWRA